MLVTQTSLVGYTLINGTWGIQLALLIASLFNVITYDDDSLVREINTYYTTFVPTNDTFVPQSYNLTSS
jgi:hypothetical protein